MSINFEREGKRDAYTMPDQKDTHGAWKSKGCGYKTKRVLQDYITSDAYEDSLIFDMRLFSKALIHIDEIAGVNAIKYTVLACLDPSIWETIKTETPVLAGATAKEVVTDAWNWLKVQVASNVGGSAGKVNVFINGKTP